MSTEKEETHQRLKAAVHYNVGRMCQGVGEKGQKEFSRHVMAAIAETTFRQCDVFANDLEAFARHAKRSTINAEDVKLLARRSRELSKYIQKKSEELASSNQEKRELKKSTGKRKNVDTEESME